MQPDEQPKISPDQNPYDFITNPMKPKRGGPNLLSNPGKRKFVLIGFVLSIITIVVVALAVFSSLTAPDNSDAIEIVQHQAEMIRVVEVSKKEATDPTLKAKLSVLSSYLATDQSSLIAYLEKSGAKIDETILSTKTNKTTTDDITSAGQQNRADTEIISALEKLNATYKDMLSKSLDKAPSPNKKATLEQAAQNVLTFEGN